MKTCVTCGTSYYTKEEHDQLDACARLISEDKFDEARAMLNHLQQTFPAYCSDLAGLEATLDFCQEPPPPRNIIRKLCFVLVMSAICSALYIGFCTTFCLWKQFLWLTAFIVCLRYAWKECAL